MIHPVTPVCARESGRRVGSGLVKVKIEGRRVVVCIGCADVNWN